MNSRHSNDGHLRFFCNLGSPATSLSSLSAAAASLRPSAASSHALTPSLASHYRPDLISHVTGWPAEQLEKQVIYWKCCLFSWFV